MMGRAAEKRESNDQAILEGALYRPVKVSPLE
jgi:hypothetical protein